MVVPFFFAEALCRDLGPFWDAFLPLLAPCWGNFGVRGGHFWSILEALFGSQNGLGRHRCPKRRHPRFGVTLLGSFWGSFFVHSQICGVKKRAPEPCPFFLQFVVASSSLCDGFMYDPYTPVQSKHTFCFSHLFVNKGSRGVQHGSKWGSFFDQHGTFV